MKVYKGRTQQFNAWNHGMISQRNVLNLRPDELAGVCQKKRGYREKHVKEEHTTFRDQKEGLCGCNINLWGWAAEKGHSLG